MPLPPQRDQQMGTEGQMQSLEKMRPLQTAHVQSTVQPHLICGCSLICKDLQHPSASGPPTEAPKRGHAQNQGVKQVSSLLVLSEEDFHGQGCEVAL